MYPLKQKHPETLIHILQSGSIERGPIKGSTSQELAFKRRLVLKRIESLELES
jgi:hypothetical protein